MNLWPVDWSHSKPVKKWGKKSVQMVRGSFVTFGFSEKATKLKKNLHRTFDKSVVFCARNSVLVKKLTKIFQNKCGQVVSYKLYRSNFLQNPYVSKLFSGNSILKNSLKNEQKFTETYSVLWQLL